MNHARHEDGRTTLREVFLCRECYMKNEECYLCDNLTRSYGALPDSVVCVECRKERSDLFYPNYNYDDLLKWFNNKRHNKLERTT